MPRAARTVRPSGLGIVSSTRRIRTAERWQHIAWGEPTSYSEAGVTPGNRNRKTLPAVIWRLRRQITAGKIGLDDNSWGCELLAETSKPGPRLYAITAPQLSDCSKESKCSCLPLTRIAPKHSLPLLPKPDSLQVLAYDATNGRRARY